MKLFMKKGKYMSFFLIFITLLSGCNNNDILSQTSEDKAEGLVVNEDTIILEYLQNNHSAISLQDENKFNSLAILDSDIVDKEIFFTGEYHGVKANAELRMKFLKYFKEKVNFKYYLAEISHSMAYFLNEYLSSGDINILEEIYIPLKGTFEWNKDNYNFWKELYQYNNGLPDDEKIQVIGIDLEHQMINAYRFLVDILPEKEIPNDIKDMLAKVINKFDNYKESNNNDLTELLKEMQSFAQLSKELQKDIEDKESIYKEYLGEDFTDFRFVNMNIINGAEAYEYSGKEWDNFRDKKMYENFQAIQKNLPKGKYYGQWGLNHTFQSKEKDIKWLAVYLNDKESIFKDRILTIAYFYDECDQMNTRGYGNYTVDNITTLHKEIKEVNDRIGGNINIYKLIGKDSPFYEMPMPDSSTNELLEEKITDFFQYIVCIKKSKATEPLNNEYN